MTYTISKRFFAAFSLLAVAVMYCWSASPVAHNDTVTTYADHRIVVNLLANDTDADGDVLTLVSTTSPSHGTVGVSTKFNTAMSSSVGGYKNLIYVPAGGYTGSDAFNYTTSDGHGGNASATVYITVLAGLPIPPQPNPTALGIKKLSILLIGDSNTESNNYAGGLMKELEKEYGYYGSGYRSFLSLRENGGNGWERDITNRYMKITIGPGWTQNYWTGDLTISPNTMNIESSTPGANATVEFYGKSIMVYWLCSTQGGTFRLTVDGNDHGVTDTKTGATSAYQVKRTVVNGLSVGWHTLNATPVSGSVRLLGVDARLYDGTGAVALVHNWGLSASNTTHHNAIQPAVYSTALQLVNPDIVYIMLGTNDIGSQIYSFPYYINNLKMIVDRVRTAVPQARIVVSTCVLFNMGDWAWAMYKSYRRELILASASMGISFHDMFTMMGGDTSVYPSSFKTQYSNDGIHMSPEGGSYLGPNFLSFIQNIVATPDPAEQLTTIPSQAPTSGPAGTLGWWLPGDGAMKVDANGTIAEWTNMKTQGVSGLKQFIKERRPLRVAGGLNGKPTVRFNGVDDLMTAGLGDWFQCDKIMMVMKADRVGDPIWSAIRSYTDAIATTPAINGFQIVEMSPGMPFTLGHNFYVTQYNNPNTFREKFFKGEIAEIIAWNGTPSASDLSTTRTYLTNKWLNNSTNAGQVDGVTFNCSRSNLSSTKMTVYNLQGRVLGNFYGREVKNIRTTLSSCFSQEPFIIIIENGGEKHIKKIIVESNLK